jgi:hypothetical protein
MSFLNEITSDVVDASRVASGKAVCGSPANTTGRTLIRPGGTESYTAFWIRDFVLSLGAGHIPLADIEHALRLTASVQAATEWKTPSGSVVPEGSIADHITFDGTPIYFPGPNVAEEQGDPFGHYPPFDNPYFFVGMAWHAIKAGGTPALLREEIGGLSLLRRLDMAFAVPTVAPDGSEMVWCDAARRGVSFGFTDTVVHTGHLLFASLFRTRIARRLADMHEWCGDNEKARRYVEIGDRIAENLAPTFAHESGLLKASTGISAQPDVWGSAFAVYAGLLPEPDATRIAGVLLDCLDRGTIAWRGNIRHIPTDWDFSPESPWERTVHDFGAGNRYQNGAYWGTPTGWVCAAVAKVDERKARHLALDYVNELREEDYRTGEGRGSPYECIHPDGDYRKAPVYGASVSCPLGVFRGLGWC